MKPIWLRLTGRSHRCGPRRGKGEGMTDTTQESDFGGVDARRAGKLLGSGQAKAWFVHEVLPLEAMLTRYLARNWRNRSDLEDVRQEVYATFWMPPR